MSASQDSVKMNDNNPEFSNSRDYLVQEDSVHAIKVFSRHELSSTDENLSLPEIRHIYCNKNELLKVKYEINQDIDGFVY